MGTRDEYVASIKQAFVTLGSRAVMSYLTVEFPFLGLPIVKDVLGLIVDKIIKIQVDTAELGIFFLYIDVRVNNQGHEFVDAAYRNRNAQLHGTDQEKQDAEENLRLAFKRFATLTS